MEMLVAFLDSVYPLSTSLKDHLRSILKVEYFSKNEYLLRVPNTCNHVYFVQSGLVRCFYLNGDIDVSSWFMKEGDVIISVQSFFNQQPSHESIQALEDTVTHSISWDQLQFIYRQFPEFNYIGRVLTEKYYAFSEKSLYSLRMQSAAQRYDYLIKNMPELVRRVPVKFLASYLDIARETLSRMRNKRRSY